MLYYPTRKTSMEKQNIEHGIRIKVSKKQNESLFIDNAGIYNQLHQCQLLEKRLENIRGIFYKKYSCDYLAIHFFNKNNDIFLSNLAHDNWHKKYWKTYINNCLSLQISSNLKQGQNGFLFFFDLTKGANDTRAEIVGEKKEGFSVMFYNSTNGNKVQFCLTFKDGKNIDTLSKVVLQNLLEDLKKSQEIIDDFMEYFKNHGELNDSSQLSNFIEKRNYLLKIS